MQELTKCEKELLNAAVEEYGKDAQIKMVTEEAAELIQAVNKWWRGKAGALANLHEELADMEIMIAQMRLIFLQMKLTAGRK